MTDREALIEAMRFIQRLYSILRGIDARVSALEKRDFDQIAAGYQREIQAKEQRLTDEQIREIEAEIQSKNTEDPC